MKKDQKQQQDEELKKLQAEFSDLQARFDGLTNQLKRAVADYQNLEKRVSEGRSELTAWVTGDLIKRMLPVLDHLEKAAEGAGEEERMSGWFKGVEMSIKQLKDLLKNEGLEEITETEQFNPVLHEAVDIRQPSPAESASGKADNSILEIARKGYTLKGKLLRPTQVVVGRLERS